MVNAKDPMNVSFKKRVYHRNYVNRFVTPFMAQPHGFFESHFLIGLDKNPRSVCLEKKEYTFKYRRTMNLDNYSR